MKCRFALFLISIAIAASSCKENSAKVSTRIDTASYKEAIALSVFSKIPDTIDGCGHYYAYDSIGSKQEKYIFLSRLDELAIIQIAGEVQYLIKDSTANDTVEGGSFNEVYSGNGYKVVLDVKKYRDYYEGSFYKGTLKISKGEETITISVNGQTGC